MPPKPYGREALSYVQPQGKGQCDRFIAVSKLPVASMSLATFCIEGA